ncbi:MAG: hypothetical protein ACKV2T_07940 [Kofleriaceae bacterium]
MKLAAPPVVLLLAVVGCTAPTSEDLPPTGDPGGKGDGTGASCRNEKLVFSADELPTVPSASSKKTWGGNATQGNHVTDPPYDADFLAYATRAKQRGLRVFAYLEGPCGDTGGVDDGERARCRNLHNNFNDEFAPDTPDTALSRWKPYTFAQMARAEEAGVDYCEIDNLSNNVTVPLIPLMQELKELYDTGEHTCRIVFKNLSADDIYAIKDEIAPTEEDAEFIAPFHIYEADDTSDKADLDEAMRDIKGTGAVTVISLDTNAYGSDFTPDTFRSCGR